MRDGAMPGKPRTIGCDPTPRIIVGTGGAILPRGGRESRSHAIRALDVKNSNSIGEPQPARLLLNGRAETLWSPDISLSHASRSHAEQKCQDKKTAIPTSAFFEIYAVKQI